MDVVCLDQHNIAGSDWVRSVSFVDFSFTFDYENFVFVGMVVQGSEAPWSDFELPHGEIGRTIVAAEQPTDLATAGAGHGNGLQLDGLRRLNFH